MTGYSLILILILIYLNHLIYTLLVNRSYCVWILPYIFINLDFRLHSYYYQYMIRNQLVTCWSIQYIMITNCLHTEKLRTLLPIKLSLLIQIEIFTHCINYL